MADQSQTFLDFAKNWAVAMDAGLMAAGELYAEAVQAKLARGYTSGRYVGDSRRPVAASVRVAKPANDRKDGQRVVRVGSRNPLARLWELGHHNRFTGRFERVEHWRLTAEERGADMAKTFHDVFTTVLGAS